MDLPMKKIAFLIALLITLKIIAKPMKNALVTKPIAQKVFLIALPKDKINALNAPATNKIGFLIALTSEVENFLI